MPLSAIIPALNEEAFVGETIQCIKAAGDDIIEIIVVDCGSTDRTVSIAREHGCRILKAAAGARFRPLNKGGDAARGDVLLFIDADTLLPAGFARQISACLADQRIVGGAFEFAFIERGWALRIVEWVNRIRYRIAQRYYGDQAIFVRRSAFERLGGYPRKQILEAADFCGALRNLGQLRLLKSRARTSARRFLEGGVWRVFVNDAYIWLRDTLGLSVEKQGKQYWESHDRASHKTD